MILDVKAKTNTRDYKKPEPSADFKQLQKQHLKRKNSYKDCNKHY